jgi:hypothetical protein
MDASTGAQQRGVAFPAAHDAATSAVRAGIWQLQLETSASASKQTDASTALSSLLSCTRANGSVRVHALICREIPSISC